MFDDKPTYLGGLTTQLQDSMNGLHYGRDNKGHKEMIPNDASTGRVYRDMPTKTAPKDAQPVPRGRENSPTAVLQSHLDRLKQDKIVEFYQLKLPKSLVESTPNPAQWLKSLQTYISLAEKNAPLTEYLQNPNVSVALLSLELIQPGTIFMDTPSKIQRAQQMMSVFQAGQQSNQQKPQAMEPVINQAPVNETVNQNMKIYEGILKYTSKNISTPKTPVGIFRVPVSWLSTDKAPMLAYPNLLSMMNQLEQNLVQGNPLDPTFSGIIIPIIIWTLGQGPNPNDPNSLLPMIQKIKAGVNQQPNANANMVNANANVNRVNANANVNANTVNANTNTAIMPNSLEDIHPQSFLQSTTGKVVVGASILGILYKLSQR